MATANLPGMDKDRAQESSAPIQTICLHVMSPGPENRQTFPSLPLNTTIGELKHLIAASSPGQLVPERQRLIYRGRRLAVDTHTLSNVFGQIEAGDTAPTYTIHLVLPPVPPIQGTEAPPQLQIRPNVPETHPLTSPQSQTLEEAQNTARASALNLLHDDRLMNALPPDLQNNVRETLTAIGDMGYPQSSINVAAAAASHNVAQNPDTTHHAPLPQPGQLPGNPPLLIADAEEVVRRAFPPQYLQSIINTQLSHLQAGHQPQVTGSLQRSLSALDRSVQGLQNTISHRRLRQSVQRTIHRPVEINTNGQDPVPQQSQISRIAQTSVIYPSHSQGHTEQDGNMRRETRMSVSYTSSFTRPRGLDPLGTQPHNRSEDPRTENTAQHNQFLQDMRNLESRLTLLEGQTGVPAQDMQRALQQLSTELEENCRNANTRSNVGRAERVRHRITFLRDSHSGGISNESFLTESISPSVMSLPVPTASDQSTAASDAISSTETPSHQAVNRPLPSVSATSAAITAANRSMVCLLSSPTGPHALVFSPRGTSASGSRRGVSQGTHVQRSGQVADSRLRSAIARREIVAEQARNPVQARQNQRHNLAAIAGSVWLLVRLSFFFWFFGLSGSWNRTLLVFAGCTIVFLAHTGVFGFLHEWWMPVREHLEGLIPLAVNNARNQERPAAATARGDQPEGEVTSESNPQEAARSLLAERRGQDGGWVQGNLRRIERAVALFMATLVPGIGERHIQARNAAEIVRLADERQAEEERRRQEEAANSGETQPPPASEETSLDAATRGDDSSSASAPGLNDQELRPVAL